jgi:hypothetical protein
MAGNLERIELHFFGCLNGELPVVDYETNEISIPFIDLNALPKLKFRNGLLPYDFSLKL